VFTVKEPKKNAELRTLLLGLISINLVTEKGGLRWFGHIDCEDWGGWSSGLLRSVKGMSEKV